MYSGKYHSMTSTQYQPHSANKSTYGCAMILRIITPLWLVVTILPDQPKAHEMKLLSGVSFMVSLLTVQATKLTHPPS